MLEWRKLILGHLRPEICRNSGSPLRIAGIYEEGSSSSSFSGCREGLRQGLSKSEPSPPRHPFKRGVFWGFQGGFPLAALDSITTSFSSRE